MAHKRVLPSTRDTSPTSDLYMDVVEVRVGKDPNTSSSYLHSGLVSFYSGYFQAALSGNFAESKSRVIELPEESDEVFTRFRTWLYTNKIDVPARTDRSSYSEIIALWSFADRREIPLLMNECINAVRDELVRTWKVPTKYLRQIYDTTTPQAGMRRLVIQLMAGTWDASKMEGERERGQMIEAALWDIVIAVWKLKDEKCGRMLKADVVKMDLCEYHVHEEGVRCGKTT
ncbi:hypothetical protein LTR27_005231 [Elasticomyces elasticus]|nr:hypothetical protein LTR27_005231 [Elasticomyces elasticus]